MEPAAAWLEEAAELYAGVRAHVPDQDAIRSFLAAPPPADDDDVVFSHNDLGIEHVLVEPATGAVTGVIDWSDAAICDAAYDFGLLLRDLGPAGLQAALARYERDVDRHALAERAWFFARCVCIEDVAFGVESGRSEYATKSLEAMGWLFGGDPGASPVS